MGNTYRPRLPRHLEKFDYLIKKLTEEDFKNLNLLQDEKDLLQEYRAIKDNSEEVGLNDDDVKHGWIKTEKASLFFKNPNFKTKEKKLFEEDLLNLISERSPNYPIIKREETLEPHALIINPADVHLGKLASAFETGDSYTVDIAVKRVKEGVNGILNKSKGFNIEKIIFVGGNDILHVDTPKRTTTSGTPQDTDGMWYDNFRTAMNLYIEVLETLIPIADVHFIYCPSNHDYTNGFFLCQAVEQYFSKNKNITFDTSIAHRKYYKYGNNLIGFTHGDGAKPQDLPLLMAHESKYWTECKHKYIYSHHLHHKISKDYMSVCVESMRSPSGTDSWHHRQGYEHSPKAVEGFLHHKEYGQIGRFNHLF